MAKYEVLELSYINDRLVQAGEVVEYDGTPGTKLKPVEAKPAPAAKEKK